MERETSKLDADQKSLYAIVFSLIFALYLGLALCEIFKTTLYLSYPDVEY